MPRPMRIDFVSDISCPWCAIGLHGLEQALARTGDLIDAKIHFQPFELNPDMAPEGEVLADHIARKYGSSHADVANNLETIRSRAAAVGFAINRSVDDRIYNTFDAHRLLHWAAEEGRQAPLKHALFEAYFGQGRAPSDHAVLIAAAEAAGLDAGAAQDVLASGRYGEEVRHAQQSWRTLGINSVPAIIVDQTYLISGGQPPEAFEQALRQIVAQAA